MTTRPRASKLADAARRPRDVHEREGVVQSRYLHALSLSRILDKRTHKLSRTRTTTHINTLSHAHTCTQVPDKKGRGAYGKQALATTGIMRAPASLSLSLSLSLYLSLSLSRVTRNPGRRRGSSESRVSECIGYNNTMSSVSQTPLSLS